MLNLKCNILACEQALRVWVGENKSLQQWHRNLNSCIKIVIPQLALRLVKLILCTSLSVWSRARHCRIATVWAKISPSNTCSGSFWRTSNWVSKEKETRKCNFSSCKIFLKQNFCLNFRRLKVKQEQKSREYDVHKRLKFLRLPGTRLNKRYRGSIV